MRWIVAPAVALSVGVASMTGPRPADAKSMHAEPYTSDIVVQPNGDLQVSEVVHFRFKGGPFTRATRRISRRHSDDVVIETATGDFTVERRRNGVHVVWHFASCSDTTIALSLRYHVRGALHADGTSARLDWRAITDERQYAIRGARATVTWPEGWRVIDARARGGVGATGAQEAVFTAARLGKEHGLRLRMEFETPVALAAPLWQQRADAQRGRFGAFAAACTAVLVIGSMLVFVQRREIEPGGSPVLPVARAVTAPPAALPPPLVGALRRGGAGMTEAQACLGDLARRGYLEFETERAKTRWAGGIYFLRRRHDGHDLASWERIVHAAALQKGERDRVRIDQAWCHVRKNLPEFRAAVRAELERRGALDPGAEVARQRLRTTMWIWWALTGAALSAAPIAWRTFGPATLLLPVAAAIPAILAAIFAGRIPLYSSAWTERVDEWEAFRRHLVHTAKQSVPLDTRRFEAWFPYALALGVAPAWLGAAKRWQLSAPHWFQQPATSGGYDGMTTAFVTSAAGGAE